MWEIIKLVWKDAIFVLGLAATVSNAWAATGDVPVIIAIVGTVAAGTVSGVQAARKISANSAE